MRAEIVEREVTLRNPIRGIFVGCCASAEKAVVSNTVVSSQTKKFRLISFAPVVFTVN
jgi:hypothetical protein